MAHIISLSQKPQRVSILLLNSLSLSMFIGVNIYIKYKRRFCKWPCMVPLCVFTIHFNIVIMGRLFDCWWLSLPFLIQISFLKKMTSKEENTLKSSKISYLNYSILLVRVKKRLRNKKIAKYGNTYELNSYV